MPLLEARLAHEIGFHVVQETALHGSLIFRRPRGSLPGDFGFLHRSLPFVASFTWNQISWLGGLEGGQAENVRVRECFNAFLRLETFPS